MSYNSTCLLNSPKKNDLNKILDFFGFNPNIDLTFLAVNFYKRLDVHNLREDNEFKIPPISHHIWLTNLNKPREVRDSDIENLQNTISIIDNSSNTKWQHIFWVNCDSCLPQTREKLKSINVTIRNYDEIKEQLMGYATIKRLISEKKFGMAADLLREDVVNLFGGFYVDLNYVLHSSPERLMKNLNFIADSPAFMSVENYMFASSINHPILVDALTKTLDLINNPNRLIDLSGCDNNTLTHFLSYAPFVYAFRNNVNKYDTIDLAIPSRDVEVHDFIEKVTHVDQDNKITTTYVYKECSLEQEEVDDEFQVDNFQYLKAEYIKNFATCMAIIIGEDGEDGATWHENYEMVSFATDAQVLAE